MNIMLDLKTWGTTPGSDIRSIGACVFDPQHGYTAAPSGDENNDSKSFYIATDNPTNPVPYTGYPVSYKYPLTRDPATVKWWSEQSDEAQAAFADPVDLRVALQHFGEWVVQVSGECRIYMSPQFGQCTDIRLWSHGPAFDPPILAAAYRAVNLPVPWHYRTLRDTRTIFDAAGIDDHSAWLNQHPGPLGIPHHALDDAICQARAVCAAMERLREWRSESAWAGLSLGPDIVV